MRSQHENKLEEIHCIQYKDEKNNVLIEEFDYFEKYDKSKSYDSKIFTKEYADEIRLYKNVKVYLDIRSENKTEIYIAHKEQFSVEDMMLLSQYCQCYKCSFWVFNPLKYFECAHCTGCLKEPDNYFRRDIIKATRKFIKNNIK